MWLWLLISCGQVDPCADFGPLSTIDEVVQRVQDVPEDDLACVLRSLERPLEVVAVASSQSVQPGTFDSPRILIQQDGLLLTLATGGDALGSLELGQWVGEGRTRKGELYFPTGGDVDPYTHLDEGDGTGCGVCHVDERAVDGVEGAYESLMLEPSLSAILSIEELTALAEDCDTGTERCGLLQAVVGEGDISRASLSF